MFDQSTLRSGLHALGLTLTLVLGACAEVPGTPPTRPVASAPPTPGANGECNAAPAQFAVGRALDAALGAQARQSAGARQLRIIRPGQMVTMEYSSQRLTLELDAADRVASVRCG